MLSRDLSQMDLIQIANNQSKTTLQSDRLLKYISECAIILNPEGIILNFNEPSKCQFHPEPGVSISKYLKSEHIGWLKACMLGRNQESANLQFFNGSCVKECTGDCIPIPAEGVYILILQNVNQVPEELIYANVFARSIHGLLITNDEGNIVKSNIVADRLLDLASGELINFKDLMARFETNERVPVFPQPLAPHDENEMMSKVININNRNYELTKVMDIANDYHLIIIRDISEMVEYINRADQHDTLKVVGQLAAGIAHEIRNPMTSLKGFIQLLQSDLKDSQKMYFEVIQSELNRLEATMTEFLMLAKPKNSVMKKINLTRVLEETVQIMHPQAMLHDIELHFAMSDRESWTFGDANRLKQVFINLIKNAIEATPVKGHINISIQHKNNGLVASVRDYGCGIPKEKLKRLNEPFFTTKENGTGLGLPVSLKIIEEHRGAVEVISREDEGTEFNISLPLSS